MSNPVPNLELCGPNVDDDIRRLVRRYGKEQVREAVKRQTAMPRGPRPKGQWLELRDVLRADAILWLEGGDPFKERSNYSIAKNYAGSVPDHQKPSTIRRILRKLRERRCYYTLADAEWLSRSHFPYTENLRAIGALQEIELNGHLWDRLLCLRASSIADYRSKFGDPPADMTMQKLLEEAGRPIIPKQQTAANNVFQILMGSRPD